MPSSQSATDDGDSPQTAPLLWDVDTHAPSVCSSEGVRGWEGRRGGRGGREGGGEGREGGREGDVVRRGREEVLCTEAQTAINRMLLVIFLDCCTLQDKVPCSEIRKTTNITDI